MKKICRHFIVSGRVQGVFFRRATQEKAWQLGVTGWVKNLSNGGVETVACGDEKTLQEFAAWLHQGPSAAVVTNVVANEHIDEEFSEFTII